MYINIPNIACNMLPLPGYLQSICKWTAQKTTGTNDQISPWAPITAVAIGAGTAYGLYHIKAYRALRKRMEKTDLQIDELESKLRESRNDVVFTELQQCRDHKLELQREMHDLQQKYQELQSRYTDLEKVNQKTKDQLIPLTSAFVREHQENKRLQEDIMFKKTHDGIFRPR